MTYSSLYSTDQRVGDYRLLRQLGAGGFAEVYLAEQLYENGKQVAIKLLTHLMDNILGLPPVVFGSLHLPLAKPR